MTTVNLGRIGFVPKGNWVTGSYKKLDVVRFNNASYVCTTPTSTDPTDATSWQVIASDGAQGPAGPSGATGSSGGITQLTKSYNFIGSIIPTSGTMRWYPERTITISGVYLTLGVPASYSLTVDVKKNGVSILSNNLITMTPNTYKTTTRTLTQTVTSSDYITVDIISASTGSNLSIIFIYS